MFVSQEAVIIAGTCVCGFMADVRRSGGLDSPRVVRGSENKELCPKRKLRRSPSLVISGLPCSYSSTFSKSWQRQKDSKLTSNIHSPRPVRTASPSSLPRTRSQFQPPKARTYVELALRPHDHVAKIDHNSSEGTACRLGGTGAVQTSARRRTGLPWNQCTALLLRCFLGVPGVLDVRAHAALEDIACALGVPARTISETRPELRGGNLVWDD